VVRITVSEMGKDGSRIRNLEEQERAKEDG
jgi:hypothetical protein